MMDPQPATRNPQLLKSGLVALIGRPNAGKSTLLNALVGEKIAIVSDKPQTTRHRIIGVLNDPRGQIVFVDTPGVHRPDHQMNRRMLSTVHDALRGVDLVLPLMDVSEAPGSGDRFVLDLIGSSGKPAILLLNKIDLVAKNDLLPAIARYAREYDFRAIVPISALKRQQLDHVLNEIFAHLPEGEPLYPVDYLTDRSERFLVAELIREKVLQHTRNELPYSTAVIIDQFDESDRDGGGLIRIYASIIVERESQKGIVIGKRGQMIKTIGSEARQEIEPLLGARVYLDLQVKVIERWRDQDQVLDSLGIEQ